MAVAMEGGEEREGELSTAIRSRLLHSTIAMHTVCGTPVLQCINLNCSEQSSGMQFC